MKLNGIKKFLYMPATAMVFSLCGCASDPGELARPAGEDALVKFAIRFTGAAIPASRALSETDENEVREIDVLVFEPSGGTYLYSAQANGSDITTTPGNTRQKTFTVKLRQGEFDLAIVANARGIISSASLSGMTKAAALAALTAGMPEGGKWLAGKGAAGYVPMPMWGEVGSKTINEQTDLTGANALSLTRMVARVDVIVDASVGNFRLSSVQVYNYNTRAAVVPSGTAWNPTTKLATAPTIPAAATPTLGPLVYNNIASNTYAGEIYLFEAANKTGGVAKELLSRTCVVVGGVYGSDANPTYYRMDFSNGEGSSQAFLDILRNHQYTFNITRIAGPGFATVDQAFRSAPVNIEANVLQWNQADMTESIFDGQNILSVSEGEFLLDRDALSVEWFNNVLYILTDCPSGWSVDRIVDAANGTTPVTWIKTTSNGTTALTSGAANNKTKIILAVEENNTGSQRAAQIWIAAGRLRYAINVTQASVPSEFILNVNAAADYILAGQTESFTVTANSPWTIVVIDDPDDIIQDEVGLIGTTGQNSTISFTMSATDAEQKSGSSATITFMQQGSERTHGIVIRAAIDQSPDYIGRFGGNLVQDAGGVWQFERGLYLQGVDQEGLNLGWATTYETTTGATDVVDGKGNTLKINTAGATQFPAANFCFHKNNNYANITTVSDPNYIWFLPAKIQMMGIWVSYYGFDVANRPNQDVSSFYFTSTEASSTQIWTMGFIYSTFWDDTYKQPTNDVRCVRE